MKITSIELLPASKYLFIKLYTDEGIYGTGEVGAWGYLDGCVGILKKMDRRFMLNSWKEKLHAI